MSNLISRRTVAKGAAWSVPAVVVASATPAFAVSGPKPTVTYDGACKFPGSNCKGRVFQGYGLVFDVKNNDPDNAIYFCSPVLSNIEPADTFGGGTPQWTPPAGGSGCVKVDAGQSGKLYFFITNTGNSQQTNFTGTLTVQWGHKCPCSSDTHHHDAVVVDVAVTGTPPHGACQCDSDFIPA
ncbi:hypothetical protein [Aestuariimicrobium ganziense]|uniref:hypothetical protein n=1 Tax=Aestuariimicrobium ganziense TaxID=2773677 RepID=UPI001941F53C|nr:hypothetical protein [Aestuariimicrobium ganziense]